MGGTGRIFKVLEHTWEDTQTIDNIWCFGIGALDYCLPKALRGVGRTVVKSGTDSAPVVARTPQSNNGRSGRSAEFGIGFVNGRHFNDLLMVCE